jgi:hypothetical protein
METFSNGRRIDFLGINPIEQTLARSRVPLTKLPEETALFAILNE